MQGEPTLTESERQAILVALVNAYGLTDVPELAGFMLPDGGLLDFSEGGDVRAVDHRALLGFVPTPDWMEHWSRTEQLLVWMGALGLVRMQMSDQEACVSIQAQLTMGQRYALERLLRCCSVCTMHVGRFTYRDLSRVGTLIQHAAGEQWDMIWRRDE